MKKSIVLLLVLAMLLTMSACTKDEPIASTPTNDPTSTSTDPTDPGHTHSYTQTVTDPDCTNAGFTTTQAIKYGLLVAIAAFVVACIVIIIVDKSDKRLRELSVITNNFNIPVLGVIPSIEILEQTTKTEKTDNSSTEKKEIK